MMASSKKGEKSLWGGDSKSRTIRNCGGWGKGLLSQGNLPELKPAVFSASHLTLWLICLTDILGNVAASDFWVKDTAKTQQDSCGPLFLFEPFSLCYLWDRFMGSLVLVTWNVHDQVVQPGGSALWRVEIVPIWISSVTIKQPQESLWLPTGSHPIAVCVITSNLIELCSK